MKRTLAKTLSGALLAGAALALAPLLGIPASAEGPQTPSVARLSALAGRVDVRRSDADETFAGAPNASRPSRCGSILRSLRRSHGKLGRARAG